MPRALVPASARAYQVSGRALVRSNSQIAYGSADDNVYVHNLSDGSLKHTLSESGSVVEGVAHSDSYVAYGGFDNNTYVHDVTDGSLVYTFTESGDNVEGVALL